MYLWCCSYVVPNLSEFSNYRSFYIYDVLIVYPLLLHSKWQVNKYAYIQLIFAKRDESYQKDKKDNIDDMRKVVKEKNNATDLFPHT